MTATIHQRARDLLTAELSLGALASINEDGTPHQVYLWYLLAEDHLVVNSRAGRTWPTNLLRDPRFSFIVNVFPEWVSLSGMAEEVVDREQGQRDIAEMARRYSEPDVAERAIRRSFRREERVSFRLRPTRVLVHPDDTMRLRQSAEED